MIKAEIIIDSNNDIHIKNVEAVNIVNTENMSVAEQEKKYETDFAYKIGNLKDPEWTVLKNYVAKGIKGSDEKGSYHPKTKRDLIAIMESLVAKALHNNQKVVDLNIIDTSSITDLDRVFSNRFNESGLVLDASDWNTSNVKSMDEIFERCRVSIDASNWDTSNVKSMAGAFYLAGGNISQSKINNWNTSNVEDMSQIFQYADFNGDISNWDVRNVKNLSHAFEGDYRSFNGDLSKWRLDSCEDISYVFANNKYFNGNIDHWFDNNHIDSIVRVNAFRNSKVGKQNPPIWYNKPFQKAKTRENCTVINSEISSSLRKKLQERQNFRKDVHNMLSNPN